jgi:hypothetical protein
LGKFEEKLARAASSPCRMDIPVLGGKEKVGKERATVTSPFVLLPFVLLIETPEARKAFPLTFPAEAPRI